MKLGDIYTKLDALSPFSLQEAWDNSGLLLGSMEDEITTVVVSLDIDAALIEAHEEGVLFVVHHPLIFSALKALDLASYPACILAEMIRKNQKLIAMHTNFDQTHLNAYVAQNILGFNGVGNQGYLFYATVETSFTQLALHVKNTLDLEVLKTVKPSRPIRTIALCTGSGASMIASVKADVLLTGDIKYHDAMQADALGLGLIDIGHFESERYFSDILGSLLNDWPISVIISSSKNPFHYIKA